MPKGTLYLIPNTISENTIEQTIPQGVIDAILPLRHFIAEDIRTARRYLRKIGFSANFDTEVVFYELNQHTKNEEIPEFIKPLLSGFDVAVLSESGVPCVADPGNVVVEKAQELGIKVKPLVGPSSILLALMASGFNGQNFAFNGYLPIQEKDKRQKIKELEAKIYRENQTQIFIETPYRNQKLFDSLIQFCQENTRLCIARDVTGSAESIKTMTIAEWKTQPANLPKVNIIFLIYK